VTLTRVYHIRQLYKAVVSELIGVVRTLGAVLGTTSNKDLTVVGLDAAESNGNRKVLQQLLSRLSVIVNIIVSDNFLIKLEKVNTVVLQLLLLNFLYKVLISRAHFIPINRCSVWSLLVDADQLGLRLRLVRTLSLEDMHLLTGHGPLLS
jgi:hypothetical protein